MPIGPRIVVSLLQLARLPFPVSPLEPWSPACTSTSTTTYTWQGHGLHLLVDPARTMAHPVIDFDVEKASRLVIRSAQSSVVGRGKPVVG